MVELKQLTGRRRGKNGVIEEISQPIDMVLRDGKRVAWLARHSGAPLIFKRGVNKAEHEDIRKAVAKLRAEQGEFGPPADETKQPPEVPAELLEDADSDDNDE